LKEPEVAIEIIKRARDAVEVPLFLKLRTGWGRGAESVERFWQIVEAAAEIGVDVVVVHGRSVTERFRGKAEWQTVGDVKKKFNSLIVLGSGEVFDVSSLDKMRESGIDGLVVARGAVGNPWVFGQLRAAFAGEPLPAEPSLKEQAAVMREHFELVQELYKSRKSVGYFRKFAMYYCKRHPERKKVQLELMAAKTSDQFISAMKKWYGDC
jgi:tRNA-dihydrouridine synthase